MKVHSHMKTSKIVYMIHTLTLYHKKWQIKNKTNKHFITLVDDDSFDGLALHFIHLLCCSDGAIHYHLIGSS